MQLHWIKFFSRAFPQCIVLNPPSPISALVYQSLILFIYSEGSQKKKSQVKALQVGTW